VQHGVQATGGTPVTTPETQIPSLTSLTTLTPTAVPQTGAAPTKHSHTAAIVGGAVGGAVGALLLILVGALCYRKKRNSIRNRDSQKPKLLNAEDRYSYAGSPPVSPGFTPFPLDGQSGSNFMAPHHSSPMMQVEHIHHQTSFDHTKHSPQPQPLAMTHSPTDSEFGRGVRMQVVPSENRPSIAQLSGNLDDDHAFRDTTAAPPPYNIWS
jgi:hypothetical protein